LKHNGNIQVIENRVTDEDGPELSREGDDLSASPLNGKSGKKTAKRESPLPDEDSMGMFCLFFIVIYRLCSHIILFIYLIVYVISRLHDASGCATVFVFHMSVCLQKSNGHGISPTTS
jgi:hypothetical protein